MRGSSDPLRRAVEVTPVILGVDSSWDQMTKAAMDYRGREVYPYLVKEGFKVEKRQGPLARRYYVAPIARDENVCYITGVGHGTHDTYTGDYADPIFRVGDYSQEESSGKIVHLFSCHTARKLGPDFVRHGCLAYFGYDEHFAVTRKEADVFFECDSEIDRAFAEGLTAADVYDRVIGLCNERIERFRSAGRFHAAAALEFDRNHLRAPSSGREWGDAEARLDNQGDGRSPGRASEAAG